MKTISQSVMEDIKTTNGYIRIGVAITIIDKRGNYIFNRMRKEEGDMYTIKSNPRLMIKMIFNGRPWDMYQQLSINKKYIYRFKLWMKKFYKKLLSNENFIYDEKNEFLIEVVKDTSDRVLFKTDSNAIVLEPDILDDEKNGNIKIPGVRITINDPNNTMILSIDEFEDIMLSIEDINLNYYGNQLIIMQEIISPVRGEDVMKSIEEREVSKTKQYNPMDKGSIFSSNNSSDKIPETNKETVSGAIMKDTIIDNIFQI